MDNIKYRKWYLSENWGDNDFRMVRVKHYKRYLDGIRKIHQMVLSGEGFWVNDNELCIGYVLHSNPDIFRPIFSHARQQLLNSVHLDIIYPKAFWNNVKLRYYICISKIKKLPLECASYIVDLLLSLDSVDIIKMDWDRFEWKNKTVPQLYRMAFDMYIPDIESPNLINVKEFTKTVASEVYNPERSLFQRAYMDAVLMTLTHKMIPSEEKITKKVGEKWCAFIDMEAGEIARSLPKDTKAN